MCTMRVIQTEDVSHQSKIRSVKGYISKAIRHLLPRSFLESLHLTMSLY